MTKEFVSKIKGLQSHVKAVKDLKTYFETSLALTSSPSPKKTKIKKVKRAKSSSSSSSDSSNSD